MSLSPVSKIAIGIATSLAVTAALYGILRPHSAPGIVLAPDRAPAASVETPPAPVAAPRREIPEPAIPAPAGRAPKEVLLPAKIGQVPEGNDFNNLDSEFCYQRSKSTDNFVLFWAKAYGDNPMANSNVRDRFDVDAVLREADRYYDYYVDTLKWVDKDTSFATRYKFLIIVKPQKDGTAFGGVTDNKIGTFWTPATRINKGPYGVVAHELGHSFQSIAVIDSHSSNPGGVMAEMTSQYMLWQVLPEWQTFENYHLKDFMKATHLAFLHPDNRYHSCYPLEYWSYRRGVELVGKIWREARKGEDPVMTYKRLTNLDQNQFNDEMFDACRRFVTWDLPRIEKVSAPYADQHTTLLNHAKDGGFRIATEKCPQNYGYNAIQLKVPAAGTTVKLDFKGIAGEEGFSRSHLAAAGWRYGFLAHKADGTRVYGETLSKVEGTGEFTVPAGTKCLWLVVMGAPAEHWDRTEKRRKILDASADAGEQWPYRFGLTGTSPVDAIVH